GESGYYALPRSPADARVVGRIALRPELLRQERLANASVRLIEDESIPIIPREGLTPQGLKKVIPLPLRRALGRAVHGALGISGRFRAPQYRLLVDLEQRPDRASRVMLSNSTDALGMPRVDLEWRWSAADETNRERTLRVIARELERANVGRVAQ